MLIQCWVAIFCFGIWWAKLEYLNDLIKWYCVSMWIMQLSNEAHDIRYNAMNWMSFLIFFFSLLYQMPLNKLWFDVVHDSQSQIQLKVREISWKNWKFIKTKTIKWNCFCDPIMPIVSGPTLYEWNCKNYVQKANKKNEWWT